MRKHGLENTGRRPVLSVGCLILAGVTTRNVTRQHVRVRVRVREERERERSERERDLDEAANRR